MVNILLTGSTGFVGGAVLSALLRRSHFQLHTLVREESGSVMGVRESLFTDLAGGKFQDALVGMDCVVHCAARVHVMHERDSSAQVDFRRVNVDGTLNLARQAALAGVKRFIFLSSIKVNGEETSPGNVFSADTFPEPVDAYGISKHEAEEKLRALARETGIELVIIRPVLVYGPGVKANFQNMMGWLAKGVPLPLGAIHNHRSLVALDNLVDLIVTCIEHPAAANQIFLVSDGEDVSTTELLRRLASALGRPARLLPIPAWLLTNSAALLGRRGLAQRLCSSLQVDISKTKTLLGWTPPVSLDAALQRTARHFLEQR